MKLYEIKHRWSGNVLFAHEDDNNTLAITLSMAVAAQTDLRGAYLCGAKLRGADLRGLDLTGSDLRGSDLADADLRGSDLTGSDLAEADLGGADLSGADCDLWASPDQSIVNLDKVREIILDDKARLEMGHWHGNEEWVERTCAEETICGTTHCLAGWLQVCSTNPEIRGMDENLAGIVSAPVASKMFFRGADEVMTWLETRQYVNEINDKRAA